MKKKYIIPIFIPNSGCRYRCIYCNQTSQTGVLKYSISSIEAVIKYYLKIKKEWDEIAFYGGTFCGLDFDVQSELLKIAGKYLENGSINGIRFSTSPELIDESNASFYRKSRVTTIEIGVQSMDNEILAFSGRKHSSYDVFKASEIVKKNNITLGIQLMTGLPLETDEKLAETIKSIVKIKPDFIRIYPVLVFKNTALFQMYKNGVYIPDSLEEAVIKCMGITDICLREKIDIIRIGVQLSDLDGFVSGPYHPSFGFIVHSRLFRAKLEKSIQKLYGKNRKKDFILNLNKRDFPLFYGFKGENKEYFKRNYPKIEIEPLINNNIKKNSFFIDYEKV